MFFFYLRDTLEICQKTATCVIFVGFCSLSNLTLLAARRSVRFNPDFDEKACWVLSYGAFITDISMRGLFYLLVQFQAEQVVQELELGRVWLCICVAMRKISLHFILKLYVLKE